ncbi:MAG: MFS transporter [Actinomycetota bacterium]|nr:MFS transporter [Actinomycetota bacterium]
MTEPATPRTLVPTKRQAAAGHEDRRAVPAPPVPPVPVPGRPGGRAAGRLLADLDPRSLGGPPRVLVILCLSTLFARVDEQAIGVLLPQLRAEFAINLTFLTVLASVVAQCAVLGQLPAGYLADRVRRVWLVRAGTLLTAATVAAQGLVPGIGSVVAARLANGAAQSISPPASFSLQSDYFPRTSRARVFFLVFAASQVGLIVGPVVAGLLGQRLGWRPTLLALGGLGTLFALLTLLLREPVRGLQDRAGIEAPLPPPPTFSQAYRAAARISTMRRLWYATPLLNIRSVFTFLVIPAFFSEVYQFSTSQLGLFVALSGVSGLVGLAVAGPVSDRVLADRPGRLMTLMGLITTLQAALLVAVSFAPSLVVAIAATQVMVLIETALQPAFFTLIALVVPTRLRGLGLATGAPWQSLGLLGAPFIVALVARIGLQRGILVYVPLLLIGAAIVGTGGPGVERDIRAVRAAERADTRARTSDTLLVIRGLEVAYSGVQVLFGVDLDVREGEVVALVGTNGAGKSTLLRAVAGTTQASGGAVFVTGTETTHLAPHETAALGVALMPGGAATFPALTVAENLHAAAPDFEPALAVFPVLRERLNAVAGTLSGGEQQMVGLAQALLQRPRLLLVDELSLGLAPAVVGQLLDVLKQLKAAGTTIVVVEQSLNVAVTIADRAVFMEQGQIRFDGPTDELLARPELVRSIFLGGAAGGTRTPRRAAAGEMTTALDLRGLTVSFGGVRALSQVSLTVAPGEVVGLIGPNGAGKTTLLDVVSGFVAPSGGRVLLAGTDVTRLGADARARAGLGRSFQNARLFPALTVRETVATALERRAVHSAVLAALWAPPVRSAERRISRHVERLLATLGLEPYAGVTLAELSTGTRRAVDMACIIALEPSVVLLDEPSAGLAQGETDALGPLLRNVVRETGCGMLIVEHHIPLVTALADRLVAMEAGTVLVEGDPDTVRSDPQVLRSYLAASEGPATDTTGRMSTLAAALHSAPDNDARDR